MATSTNRRSYPNDYFAWYNDDDSLGIVWRSLTTDDSEGTVAGEFDTYNDTTVDNGLRITFHGHYGPIGNTHNFEMRQTGLPPALYPALICYIKSRLYEDLGEFQKAMYFKQMFIKNMNQYPMRKSGVRTLSVPKL
jgi:hypothetical protein